MSVNLKETIVVYYNYYVLGAFFSNENKILNFNNKHALYFSLERIECLNKFVMR